MNIPNLINSERLTTTDLHGMEEIVFKIPLNIDRQIAQRLITECRRLQHELADPNYNYVGRIHRNAIICRDAEIDELREEVAKLKKD